MNVENILEEIQLLLDGVANSSQGKSDSAWTKEIKRELCQLGKKNNFDVSAAGCKGADTGEWLYDLVWSAGSEDFMTDIPLVVESEWSMHFDDISWDFGKLLVSKSDIKLFVFQQASKEGVENVQQKLGNLITKFVKKMPKEYYLIAGYSYSDHAFIYKQSPLG